MLNLNAKDVLLKQQAASKEDAIRIVAKVLADNGHVDPAYVNGMLEREEQTSTYLDNGVAIPHGTTKTRDLVKSTGVAVVQFPEGVVWNEDGDKTYVAFGIAASSNEHLPILKAITNIIGEEEEAQALAKASTTEELLALIKGESPTVNLPITSASLFSLQADASELVGLAALNAATLLGQKYITVDFFTKSLEVQPVYLGSGVWLSASTAGNLANGLAIARPQQAFTFQGKEVKALVTLAFNQQGDANVLAKLVNHTSLLVTGDTNTLLGLFGLAATTPAAPQKTEQATQSVTATISVPNPTTEQTAAATTDAANTAEGTFTIYNANGLHARPSTELVRVCKQFSSEITVQNLTTGSQPVKAKSMVRVTGLGAAKGSQLRFVATGEDAQEAIKAIGAAIAAGLGE